MDRDEALTFYRRYIDACNTRSWDVVAASVAPSIVVNGVVRSRAEYVADIEATVRVFPDYRWEIRRFLVDGEWIAVRLRDQGTRSGAFLGAPGDGAAVETDEYAMYRIVGGAIVELEGTADNERLLRS